MQWTSKGFWILILNLLFKVLISVVVKDLRLEDEDEDKDLMSEDEDEDKDLGRH